MSPVFGSLLATSALASGPHPWLPSDFWGNTKDGGNSLLEVSLQEEHDFWSPGRECELPLPSPPPKGSLHPLGGDAKHSLGQPAHPGLPVPPEASSSQRRRVRAGGLGTPGPTFLSPVGGQSWVPAHPETRISSGTRCVGLTHEATRSHLVNRAAEAEAPGNPCSVLSSVASGTVGRP